MSNVTAPLKEMPKKLRKSIHNRVSYVICKAKIRLNRLFQNSLTLFNRINILVRAFVKHNLKKMQVEFYK
jgi:hypothetical protein